MQVVVLFRVLVQKAQSQGKRLEVVVVPVGKSGLSECASRNQKDGWMDGPMDLHSDDDDDGTTLYYITL